MQEQPHRPQSARKADRHRRGVAKRLDEIKGELAELSARISAVLDQKQQVEARDVDHR